MKSIINFFKSLFTTKKEEIFCETVKKESAPKAKRGRKPKTEKAIGKEVKAPVKRSKKSEN
jgi:hypothetical protein